MSGESGSATTAATAASLTPRLRWWRWQWIVAPVLGAAGGTSPMNRGQTPGLLRRLAAIFYDTLILGALLIAATALLLLFNGGEPVSAGTLWYQVYLAVILLFYFSVSWWRRGQTIGMIAWRLRLNGTDNNNASFFRCLLRALSATVSWLAVGLGFLWVLIDKRGRAWHDVISGTELVLETPVSAPEPRQQA